MSDERSKLRWHWFGEFLALLIAAISAGFSFYWMLNPENDLIEPLLSVLGAATVFLSAGASGIAIDIDRRRRKEELEVQTKQINAHTSREGQKTRAQGTEQFESLSATADRTQSGIENLQAGVSQVSEDVRNLPKYMKEQELIDALISSAAKFEEQFRHTYTKEEIKRLLLSMDEFNQLRPKLKARFNNDFSEIYDVFYKCYMELAFAINNLNKLHLPPDKEQIWNSAYTGPRRKELDNEVRSAYEMLIDQLKLS